MKSFKYSWWLFFDYIYIQQQYSVNCSSLSVFVIIACCRPWLNIAETKENEYSPEVLELLSHAKSNGIHSVRAFF